MKPPLPFALVMSLMVLPVMAMEATLNYQGDNKWVAAAENKPLIALLKEAKAGARVFQVVLPAEGRVLAVERLNVLQGLLAREAGRGVLMEEVGGKARGNTLRVRTVN